MWITAEAGEVQIVLPMPDPPTQPAYEFRFEAVHPTVSGLVAHRRVALSPRNGRESTRIVLTLSEDTPGIEGTVHDERGKPVSDALVDWTDAEGRGVATLRNRTTKDGRFAISGREKEQSHLRIQSRLHQPLILAVAEGQKSVHVVLRSRPHVIGRIVDESGNPVVRASVRVVMLGESAVGDTPRPPQKRWDLWMKGAAYSESGPRGAAFRKWSFRKTLTTDEDGRFVQPFVRSGATRIVVKAEGFQALVLDGAEEAGQRVDYGDVEIRRSDQTGQHGRLVDRTGQPIAGARLMFVLGPLNEEQVHLGTVRTDAQGRFELDGLPLGTVARVSIFAPGHGRGRSRQEVEIQADLIIEY